MSRQLLRLPAVLADYAPVSRATLYRWVAEGKFPKPIDIGGNGRTTAWIASEVEAWVSERVEASGRQTAAVASAA